MRRRGPRVWVLAVVLLPAGAAAAAGLSAWAAQPAAAGVVAIHQLDTTPPDPVTVTVTEPTTIVQTVTSTVTQPPSTTYTRASATTTTTHKATTTTTRTGHSTETSSVTTTSTSTRTSTKTSLATSTLATTSLETSITTSHVVATDHVTTTTKHVPFSHDARIGVGVGAVTATGLGGLLFWRLRRRSNGPDHVL